MIKDTVDINLTSQDREAVPHSYPRILQITAVGVPTYASIGIDAPPYYEITPVLAWAIVERNMDGELYNNAEGLITWGIDDPTLLICSDVAQFIGYAPVELWGEYQGYVSREVYCVAIKELI